MVRRAVSNRGLQIVVDASGEGNHAEPTLAQTLLADVTHIPEHVTYDGIGHELPRRSISLGSEGLSEAASVDVA